MEMDSHEERLHNMIQDSKREAAKEEAGRRAKELREKQKEAVGRALWSRDFLVQLLASLSAYDNPRHKFDRCMWYACGTITSR